MGRYFGREPRYSREELERQAQEAIDARVSMGRPPEEDFRSLEARLDAIDEAIVARRPIEPAPRSRPVAARAADEPPAMPATRWERLPVAAEQPSN